MTLITHEEGLHYNHGVSLCRAGKYEESLGSFDIAIDLKPDFADAWNYKGFALGNLENYTEAIICFDKSISINKKNADAWRNKGFALGNLQKYEEAINVLIKL